MAVIDFSEYFWVSLPTSRTFYDDLTDALLHALTNVQGEKNDGFNVLYHNMKSGLTAAKELTEFLRELARVQEDASKAHIRMVKQVGEREQNGIRLAMPFITFPFFSLQLSTGGQSGTFSPLMATFKGQTEKLAAVHNQWMLKLSDLVKDVIKYSDELHKVHKKVKEDEAATLEAVKNIQDTTALLQKSKEAYKQRCLEVERMKRDNTSAKELEKSEAKFRKAQEDYKSLVDKYCLVRDDFEKKMTLSSKHFQEVEEAHLKQMREFVESYCQIVDNNHNQWGRVRITTY